MKGARRKIEGASGIKVGESGEDAPGQSSHDAQPQPLRDPSDAADAAIEEKRNQQTGGNRDAGLAGDGDAEVEDMQIVDEKTFFRGRPEIGGVLRESDASGGDGERRAERKLPDEEERKQASQALRAETFLQILIRAAGAGKRSAQLSPYHAVAECE